MPQHFEKDVPTKEEMEQPRKFTRLLREYMTNHKLTLVGVLAPGVACVTDAKLAAIHICFLKKHWEPRRPPKLKRLPFKDPKKRAPLSTIPFNGSITDVMQYAQRSLVPSCSAEWFTQPQKLFC